MPLPTTRRSSSCSRRPNGCPTTRRCARGASIALRGAARTRLGAALAEASGQSGDAAAKLAAKPERAPLLLAIVAVGTAHPKVPEWEQDTAAAGVAHLLSLLLDDAGWGVMWRTGPYTRHPAVAAMHGLGRR